jgi:predicted RNase H-like HicB family nuclease
LQEKEALESLLESEKVAATEAWLDNVVATVYIDSPPEVLPDGDTVDELGSAANLKEGLERDLEIEKQEVLEKCKSMLHQTI